MILELRPYQRDAILAVREAWGRGMRRPALVLPTGAGKTVVFAHLVAEMLKLGVRSLILAHRDELIAQAVAKLLAVAPNLLVGVWKGSRRELELAGRPVDVVVASVQSLQTDEKRAELARAGLRLVIVDECHHAVADTYWRALEALGAFGDDPLVGAYALGVTATMSRSDRVALGEVWESVVYQQNILDLIKAGHLVNAKGVRVRIEGLDLSKVRRSGGDWRDGALAQAMSDAMAPKAIVRAWLEHAAGRPTIAFGPTVAFAYELADAFAAEGIAVGTVDGQMGMTERRRALADFASGRIEVITNCAVLTEGFDAPWCSCVLMARPTSSAGLFVQMAGRGLRPHPGKSDCVILDVAGATGRHRLASLADLAGVDRVRELPDDLAEYGEALDLLELFEEPAGAGMRHDPVRHDGALTHEIVDLFGTRRSAWLRSQRGVWFLSNDKVIVFLSPGSDVGLYNVCKVPVKGRGGEFVRTDVDLEMAMSWGEQAVIIDGVSVNRGAQWRRGAPSLSQIGLAARLGIETDGMSKGELSDAISIRLTGSRVDQMPVVRTVTPGGYW